MHEIKLYGEVVPFEDNWIIEMGGYVNLTYLQQQLKEANGSDVKIRINSCGGDVDTGFAMYAELRRYAKENKAKVVTFGECRVASIATVFFLAGDERILTEHTEPFVHNAWTYVEGDSKTITRVAVELEKYNAKIAQHYANHTELTFDEALELMNAETSITTEEAKAMRFATDIEEVLRPVALRRFTNKQTEDMNKNKKTPSILAKAEAFLKSIGVGVKNKLVMSADEVELDFYELEEDEVIEVGANVRIDGDDTVTADYVMKSGETYKIVDGVLAEIVEPADDDTSADAVALQAEIDNLTSQLEAITNKAIELEATNKSQSAVIQNLKKIGSKAAPEGGDKNKPAESTTVEKGTMAKAAITGLINKQLKK